ncbi:CRISPR-associated exonuclease, Cas4 family [Seinonella peptonophila]|uniref:CRISPR-associated exonuclease Cas4 n=1 Tax=Seinonella peptonophila TaxID=112248 RepID=A0A1M5B542_9BACL|nr:CRISPR-associated protein Cas4 [Seinonella peptonophila]SHF37550.1 CRISPR-associated exonuclease, Cas4 family [Seinonella peptonophila]
MELFVEGHAINAYAFCPRRCYYEYVERIFYHNLYTMHGKLLHDHVDTLGQEKRGERTLFRSLYLSSEKLGLSVRCDVVEEEEGQVYPVEYKRGKLADWENNELQLCAQALLLEENLGTTIPYGYLFFYGSYHRKKVVFGPEIRMRTLDVIQEIRQLYQLDEPPAGIDEWKRCKKCSMVDYCLPQDRNQLRGKVEWEHFI